MDIRTYRVGESVNNIAFMIIVFGTMLSSIISASCLVFTAYFNDFKVTGEALKGDWVLSQGVCFVIFVIAFVRDRRNLRSAHAFCPSAGWFFIFPAYVFIRQARNNFGLKYFYFHLISLVVAYFAPDFIYSMLHLARY